MKYYKYISREACKEHRKGRREVFINIISLRTLRF
jgi:hypothetical protein